MTAEGTIRTAAIELNIAETLCDNIRDVPDFPLVSIILPVYNGAALIGRAVESVLRQTYSNYEIIVVDDGSNDRDELERALSGFSKHLRLFHQPNKGVAAALNRGLRESRGSLFSWLSHDDFYYPDKLKTEVEAFLGAPEEAVIASDYCYVDVHGRELGCHRIPDSDPNLARVLLLQNDWVHGCAMLIPKYAIEAVGWFNEGLYTTQDYDLFFRLAEKFPFRHVSQIVSAVTIHAGQTTYRLKTRAIAEQDALYREYLGRVSDREIQAFTGAPPCEFVRFLYRKYTFGLLPNAARCAKVRAWRAARNPINALKIVFDILVANRITVPLLRPWLLSRAAAQRRRSLQNQDPVRTAIA